MQFEPTFLFKGQLSTSCSWGTCPQLNTYQHSFAIKSQAQGACFQPGESNPPHHPFLKTSRETSHGQRLPPSITHIFHWAPHKDRDQLLRDNDGGGGLGTSLPPSPDLCQTVSFDLLISKTRSDLMATPRYCPKLQIYFIILHSTKPPAVPRARVIKCPPFLPPSLPFLPCFKKFLCLFLCIKFPFSSKVKL